MRGDELLDDARRIFDLEIELERVNRELSRAKAEYVAKLAKLTNGDADQVRPRNGGSNGPVEGPLRGQILALLRGASRALSLDEIQDKVGEQRPKVMWTLANLRRAGLAENPRRGYWQRGQADVEEDADDPDDVPALSSF